MAKTTVTPVTIKVADTAGADKTTQLQVFIVDNTGAVIETAPLKGNEAALTTAKTAIKGSRIFIAPAFPKELPAAKINARTLTLAGAHEVTQNFTSDTLITVANLPAAIYQPPRWSTCKVAGIVNNTANINGIPVTGPLCNARIHIYNVERRYWWPIWLLRPVPSAVLAELKNNFKAILAPNFVPPIPDPGPVEELSVAMRAAIATESLMARKAVANAMPAIPANVHAEIQAATVQNIQTVLSKYHAILYPYMCWWPIFWDWFYFFEEQATVYTDCNGHYEGDLFRSLLWEENIYISVDVNINGQWVTVYNPPALCNTHWNYDCSTPINIALTDQNIPPCHCGATVPEGSVWFTSIGNYGIALNIQQDPAHTVSITQSTTSPVPPQTVTFKNVGCTNLWEYKGNQLAPFGGRLDFYIAFGNNPPSNGATQATHYRWTVKQILDANQNPIPSPVASTITGAINRSYMWMDPVTLQWHVGSIPLLDTDAHNNVGYQIPKFLPTAYAGVPANAEWQAFNFLSAMLDSHSLTSGYTAEFDLELLYKDATGTFQVLTVPENSFQVSKDTNVLDGSVPAPAAYLNVQSGNTAKNLSLKVRIDNAAVAAHINDVVLLDNSGNPVPGSNSGPCGFINYTNESQKVRISFIATEPFDFAYFSFNLWRGDSGYISQSQAGYVFSNVGIYTESGGTFTADVAISALLGSCVGRAAFGGALEVKSSATDGYNTLWVYGAPYYASSVLAFALTNS